MKFLIVFVCVFIGNAIWTLCVSKVSEKQAFSASNFSALLEATALAATIMVVREPIYIVPAIVGAWAGTYFTVLWLKRRSS